MLVQDKEDPLKFRMQKMTPEPSQPDKGFSAAVLRVPNKASGRKTIGGELPWEHKLLLTPKSANLLWKMILKTTPVLSIASNFFKFYLLRFQ